MPMSRPIASLLLVLLAGGVAEAAAPRPKCLAAPGLQVVYAERADSVGSTILVQSLKPGETRPCGFQKRAGDYAVGGPDDADYVLGLAGSILVLDQGTGPDRTLALYDLAARRVALTRAYDSDAPVAITPTQISFAGIVGPATAATCPAFREYKKNGLEAVLVREVTVRLPCLAETAAGAPRCIPQQ
ncbi:hypothetical protein [Aquabacter spiritensis]|uniref:Uncharacterized protein n=1 Tax=Aquabacter spiritensis TaxID=933073 RepID=A0A4V2UXN6_9HYPH|nr:hypothetical protein [Aquabacter spiritensis]TCT04188.1 hypothetical protein EDC64_1073 [Aquabacter spiritensis]